jgi:hypothetical protein
MQYTAKNCESKFNNMSSKYTDTLAAVAAMKAASTHTGGEETEELVWMESGMEAESHAAGQGDAAGGDAAAAADDEEARRRRVVVKRMQLKRRYKEEDQGALPTDLLLEVYRERAASARDAVLGTGKW